MPLLVTVELIPLGDYTRKEKLGQLYIENDGTGDEKIGNYKFVITKKESDGLLGTHCVENLKGFRRKKGFWALIKEILTKVKDIK